MLKKITSIILVGVLASATQYAETAGSAPEEQLSPPKLIEIGGYLRPEEIAIPPNIPGYRIYQIDREVVVPGSLEGGGSFEVVLPLYVYFPNSKTLNMTAELRNAVDSFGVIETEYAAMLNKSSITGSRNLNENIASLKETLERLLAIHEEEIASFER